MKTESICHFSRNLQRDMTIKIYGERGVPFLVFPTQDAMSDNFENFGMIKTLANFIEGGQIKLYCIDTIDKESWSNVYADKSWRAERQEAYYRYVVEEVLPLIDGLPVTTGCSLGGLHAAIVFLRRPELFAGMLSLSGVYDAKYFFEGWSNPVLYENSPTDFLANMPTNHYYIDLYNAKKIILCVGQGRWEEECLRTVAIMRDIFAAKKINAWVDFWGYDVDHDWPWWKKQIVYFLPHFLKEES